MKSALSLMGILAILTGFASSATAAVIHTASYNDHTYHLLDTDGTKWWLDAEAEAISLGGHLATINDAAEDQWVFDTFAPVALTYANDNNLPDRDRISLWIGFSDRINEGTYQWSSGQPNGYLNWSPGEPASNAPDEDFGGIFVNFGIPGKWHDILGDNRGIDLPFGVVEVGTEIETVPESSNILGLVILCGLGVGIEIVKCSQNTKLD